MRGRACAVARPYAASSNRRYHCVAARGVTGYAGGKISSCCLVIFGFVKILVLSFTHISSYCHVGTIQLNEQHRVPKNVPPLACYNFWYMLAEMLPIKQALKRHFTVPHQITCASALPGKTGKRENCIFPSNAILVHCLNSTSCLIMAALCNRGPLYFCPVVSFLLSFFFSSPNLSGRRLDVYHTLTHGVKSPKIAIWSPSHSFDGLYLRN